MTAAMQVRMLEICSPTEWLTAVFFGILWTGKLDWIVQCFTSPPTQYRLYGRRNVFVDLHPEVFNSYWLVVMFELSKVSSYFP